MYVHGERDRERDRWKEWGVIWRERESERERDLYIIQDISVFTYRTCVHIERCPGFNSGIRLHWNQSNNNVLIIECQSDRSIEKSSREMRFAGIISNRLKCLFVHVFVCMYVYLCVCACVCVSFPQRKNITWSQLSKQTYNAQLLLC